MSEGEHAKKQAANASKKAAAIAAHDARVATARAVFFAGVAPAGASSDGGGSAEAGSSAGCSGASGSTPSSAHDGRGSDDAGTASQPQACESPGEFDEPADARVSGRLDVRPAPVDAELDEDNEDDAPDDLGGGSSVMGAYLKAAFDRLHSETTGEASRSGEEKWLLGRLKAEGAGWWLRGACARSLCRLLGLEYGEPSYYRDVKVWLPDEQWGAEAMPPCPVCESARDVGVHSWQNVHYGRRICSMSTHYYIISRRYIWRAPRGQCSRGYLCSQCGKLASCGPKTCGTN